MPMEKGKKMPRLIDANELYVDARCGENEEPYISLYQINDAPTVDAEPVRHGKDIYMQGDGHCEFKCSVCGVEIPVVEGGELDGGKFNYCPNCGAKMDEVDA